MQLKLPLQPPSVLNMGPPGSGKTDALTTFIEAGIELFVIVTEPDGAASLIDAIARRKLDLSKLHWATCIPTTMGWEALEDMTKTIGSMGFDQIQNIKSGIGKTHTREPAMKLLSLFKNFVDDRTGTSYGPVDKWENSRALAIDSLSGLSLLSLMLAIGYKPAAHQGEWGVSQNFIEQLLNKISGDRRCFFALNAHVERETNELTGATQVMVSTLGRKLPPKIPRFFSEVVLSKRTVAANTATFTWSTVDMQADLKNRSLPLSPTLQPSYVPIVRAYQKRLELAKAPPQADAKTTGPVSVAST
jgi:hypothetical protein